MAVLIKVKIKEEVGKACISSEKGQKIYELIYQNFKQNESVTLDFDEVKVVSALFLNAAIGQLLENFEPEWVRNRLEYINLQDCWRESIELAISHSESYYKNPDYKKALNGILQERSDNPESW